MNPSDWPMNMQNSGLIINALHFEPFTLRCTKKSGEVIITSGNNKVSMLTHTYPHKPLRKIKVVICNHQADNPLYMWPDV